MTEKGFTNDAIPALSVCESPIEGRFIQAFFDCMAEEGRSPSYLPQGTTYRVGVEFKPTNDEQALFALMVQVAPSWLKGKRIDLALHAKRNGCEVRFSVELDGKEFHRTDDQRNADRWKDRQMLRNEFLPVRYSGSEVYADPVGCAIELIGIADYLLWTEDRRIYEAIERERGNSK